ncbi:rhamnose ABC transporter substrate-binding protein [Streptomyces sp. SID7909]|uniref:rhamnose ABC transporter substrate-binding protein n=1 Tax=Streptomyces sp. SID7909 TaxID=2706092 RepID=UPI0013BB7038|nr:rhamnose ABC transporter substrate-binding protein [Streptomyces sp. SID7909]NEC07777.1 rhamnose ABC transporter substrate-binding protein [Streptomyces sp. SID7909]
MQRAGVSRSLTGLAALLALVLGSTACDDAGSPAPDNEDRPSNAVASSTDPKADIKKGLTIGFVPKQADSAYFALAGRGGRKAVTDMGSTFVEKAPESAADTSGQVAAVNALRAQGADAIVISAQSTDALCPALKKALADGIKVVTYDSDTRPECRNIFVSQASAQDLGWIEVELIGKQIGYRGEIAVLSGGRSATNQNTWIRYMKNELADGYQEMKIVDIAYGDDDPAKSRAEFRRLLAEHPDLKGVVSPTTVGLKAAADYLSVSPYKGKVALTGLGTPNDMRPYVKNGTVEQFALWDPSELGEVAAHAALSLASGKISGKAGQGFWAVGTGWFIPAENGVVTLGEPTVFDAKNIDAYDF